MIFSSYIFIMVFLPIVFLGYFLLQRFNMEKLAKIYLIIASLVFYAYGSIEFFPFFIMSIFGNYIIGTTLGKLPDGRALEKKILFVAGIFANIALLGYYKYTDFFIENVNWITGLNIPLKNIVLPIGISFFTFQLIAYLVDSYRGECKEYDIVSYLLFITFFPQLIVGPIVHHAEVVPQFEDSNNYRLNKENVIRGIFLFSIGCAKKILLADVLTTNAEEFFYADGYLSTLPTLLDSWYHAIEYTVSYYFDLSGYADMAIGLGLLFNIRLPQNFNSPYKARNFQDYWQRWHITLSRFLSAYVFRSVYRRDDPKRNYYIATMITFLVSGFWHGAGWTFVLWGLINGVFVCTASYMKRHNMKFPSVIAYPLTALGIVGTRVLFISNSFSAALWTVKGMFNFSSVSISSIGEFFYLNKRYGLILVIALIICWFFPNSREMSDRLLFSKKSAVLAAVLMGLAFLSMNKVVDFLYFQF